MQSTATSSSTSNVNITIATVPNVLELSASVTAGTYFAGINVSEYKEKNIYILQIYNLQAMLNARSVTLVGHIIRMIEIPNKPVQVK